MSDRSFPGASSRVLLGGIVLLVSASLALGQWWSLREPMAQLAYVEQHRSPGDSALYATVLYHGSHARAIHARRWSVSGYATLGLAGCVLGAGLLVSGLFVGSPTRRLPARRA